MADDKISVIENATIEDGKWCIYKHTNKENGKVYYLNIYRHVKPKKILE